MPMVSVFLFIVDGENEGVQVQPNRMATLATIEKFNGRVIVGSKKEVDAKEVDLEGFYLFNQP